MEDVGAGKGAWYRPRGHKALPRLYRVEDDAEMMYGVAKARKGASAKW